MTRKSRRELEHDVEQLVPGDTSDEPGPMLLHKDSATGQYRTPAGAIVDPVEVDPIAIIETEGQR